MASTPSAFMNTTLTHTHHQNPHPQSTRVAFIHSISAHSIPRIQKLYTAFTPRAHAHSIRTHSFHNQHTFSPKPSILDQRPQTFKHNFTMSHVSESTAGPTKCLSFLFRRSSKSVWHRGSSRVLPVDETSPLALMAP